MGFLDSFCNLIPGIIMVMILAQGVTPSLAQQETAGNSTGSAKGRQSYEEFKNRHDQHQKDFDRDFAKAQSDVETGFKTTVIVAITIPVLCVVGCIVGGIIMCVRTKRRGGGMMNGQTGQIMAPAQQYNGAYGYNMGGQPQYSGQQPYGQQYQQQQPNDTTTTTTI